MKEGGGGGREKAYVCVRGGRGVLLGQVRTLRGLIFAKIYFREFRKFCLNSRKYVFAKYLNVTNSRKFVFAKYLNNTNSRKFSFLKYSKNCRLFAKINPRFFPEVCVKVFLNKLHNRN